MRIHRTYFLLLMLLFRFSIVFCNPLIEKPDTILINKIPIDTVRTQSIKEYDYNNVPTVIKSHKVKVNDILVFSGTVLPSADLRIDYEIISEDFIEFLNTDCPEVILNKSNSDKSSFVSNGGDKQEACFTFRAVKSGTGKVLLKKTQYDRINHQTEVIFDIVP